MKTKTLKLRNSKVLYLAILFCALWLLPQQSFAHCDSYDGPVVKDALKALEMRSPVLVFKWINQEQEKEITELFNKTLQYKNKDAKVYELLKKHFLETLVRLHRETEGEPFTGLKPAGNIKPIIQKTDAALENQEIDSFLTEFGGDLQKVIREKYNKVAELKLVKDNSVEQGRAFVAAYVDYTHSIEALHEILEHGAHHPAQN